VAETIPSSAGGGRNAFYFARFLALNGAKTQIICLNYNNNLPKTQVTDKVNLIRVAYYNLFFITKLFSLFSLIKAYIKAVKTNDILFIYGRYLPAYIIILMAGNFYHKRVIFRSTLLNDDDLPAIKKHTGLLWPVYKYAFMKINLYYAINSSFEKKWKSVFFEKVPVTCTIQGVDTGIFKSSFRKLRPFNNSSEELMILSCGIVIERKGYKQAFQTLSKLDIPFKYKVIGQYMPDKFHRSSIKEAREMESLYKLGKELLCTRIEFINSTENIMDYFAEADLFLHLAKEEGTPNVLLEAMAMGLPIITGNIEGLSNIIKPRENMEVINSDNELLSTIKNLSTNLQYSSRLGENAAITIEKEFTFDHIAAKIFEKLIIE